MDVVLSLLIVTNTALLATLVLWARRPSRCFDQALKMLADEQGDWYVETVLSHELGKILQHNTKALDPSADSEDDDSEASEDEDGEVVSDDCETDSDDDNADELVVGTDDISEPTIGTDDASEPVVGTDDVGADKPA